MNELADKSSNDEGLRELALFAGAGGGILGGKLLGWRTVCAVEWEPYPASVLVARQNDGFLPPFPIWDDVQTFDGKPWRGIVDVVSGGFPCQDISAAGKGAGITGERSGMWKHMARIISEVQPKYVFVENSPMLTVRGLGTVFGDLSEMGFNAEWGVISAADIGAPHLRERIWIVAKDTKQRDILPHTIDNRDGWGKQQQASPEETTSIVANSKHGGHSNKVNGINGKTSGISQENWQKWSGGRMSFGTSGMVGERPADWLHHERNMAYADSTFGEGNQCTKRGEQKRAFYGKSSWWEAEPNVGRVANGVAARVDRLKAIGNGQVPLCAATAWKVLKQIKEKNI